MASCRHRPTSSLVEPLWPSDYAFHSEYTRQQYGAPRKGLLQSLIRITTAKVLEYAEPISGKWLEIGCGPGTFLPTLAGFCDVAVGMDIDYMLLLDAAALTKAMLGSSIVTRASGYRLPFRNNSLDGIVCIE